MFRTIKKNGALSLRGSWGVAAAMLMLLVGLRFLLTLIEHMALALAGLGQYFRFPLLLEQFQWHRAVMHPVIWVVTAVVLLLTVLLIMPLTVGMKSWYYQLGGGQRGDFSTAFRYYEQAGLYAKSILLKLALFFRKLVWFVLLFFIPAALAWLCMVYLVMSYPLTGWEAAGLSFGFMAVGVLSVLALAAFLLVTRRYQLAVYLFVEDPEKKLHRAIRTSVKYTKGYRGQLLLFQLSFIGWWALCVLIVPFFYVYPYYHASEALLGRYLIEKGRREYAAQAQVSAAETQGESAKSAAAGEAAEPAAAPPAQEEAPASSQEEAVPAGQPQEQPPTEV